MSHVTHVWTSHVTHVNRQFFFYECITHKWVMSHISTSHVTHVNRQNAKNYVRSGLKEAETSSVLGEFPGSFFWDEFPLTIFQKSALYFFHTEHLARADSWEIRHGDLDRVGWISVWFFVGVNFFCKIWKVISLVLSYSAFGSKLTFAKFYMETSSVFGEFLATKFRKPDHFHMRCMYELLSWLLRISGYRFSKVGCSAPSTFAYLKILISQRAISCTIQDDNRADFREILGTDSQKSAAQCF